MRKLRVVAIGLGPIGRAAAAFALSRRSMEVVGAVDVDPGKIGRDLGELLSLGYPLGVKVEGDGLACLDHVRPDAVLLCTASSLPEVREPILWAAAVGADVVSSCEQLLLPDLRNAELAAELRSVALEAGITVLGTGVNPGFVLDFLPVIVSAACRRVDSVRALRVVDAADRREPLQRKVGIGLDFEEFHRLKGEGRLGHVGMLESVALVGRALHLDLDEHLQTVEPVIAEEDLELPSGSLVKGQVAGIRNVGQGKKDGEVKVQLELQMYAGAREPRDVLRIEGEPPIHLQFVGGVPGDAATAAILVNSLHQVAKAPPGLKTVLDIPPPRLSI